MQALKLLSGRVHTILMQTVEEKGSNLDWVSQPLREQKLFLDNRRVTF